MTAVNSVGNSLTGLTGTGLFVGATSPSLVTPALGTPTSGVLSSCTGYAQSALTGLGTGVSTALGSNVTGSGGIVLVTSPTMVTPVLGAASATSIAFSSTSGIIGTTTNNDAAAGSVGEYISASVSGGSPTILTTNTTINLTSISLTAGDWDVWCSVGLAGGSGILIQNVAVGASSTSTTFPAEVGGGAYVSLPYASSANGAIILPTGQARFSLSGTTTIYMVVRVTFTVAALGAYGIIAARRVR